MAYAATSDIHAYGNIPASDSGDDTYFVLLVTRAQAIIDAYTGRNFETDSSATYEYTRYYTAAEDVLNDTLFLDYDLNEFSSASFIVVGSDTWTSTDYTIIPRNIKPYYAIRLKENSPRDWGSPNSDGEYLDAIQISGQWGYSSVAPADIKHATCRLVRWMFEMGRINPQEDRPIVLASGTTVLPARMPNDVTSILDRYRRVNVYG